MFSTTSAVFDLLAGDRLSGSIRKAWQLNDAREWESTTAFVVRSSVLAMVVAAGGRWATSEKSGTQRALCSAPPCTTAQLNIFHQQVHMLRCERTHDTYA